MQPAPDNPDVVEVRPGPVRRWLLPVALPLVPASLLLLGAKAVWGASSPGDYASLVLAGAFGFGFVLMAGTLIAAVRSAIRQPRSTLVLSPAGLTLFYPPGPGTIPWHNVETIGSVPDDWVGRTVGLRLSSYDEFLESMSEKERAKEPPLEQLRTVRGFDVQVPRRMLDRSLEEFFELLCGYWEEYGKG